MLCGEYCCCWEGARGCGGGVGGGGGYEDEDGDEDGGEDEDEDEDGSKVSRKRVRRSSFSQTSVSTISGDETDTSLPRVIKRVRSAMASGTAHSPIRIDSPRKYI